MLSGFALLLLDTPAKLIYECLIIELYANESSDQYKLITACTELLFAI